MGGALEGEVPVVNLCGPQVGVYHDLDLATFSGLLIIGVPIIGTPIMITVLKIEPRPKATNIVACFVINKVIELQAILPRPRLKACFHAGRAGFVCFYDDKCLLCGPSLLHQEATDNIDRATVLFLLLKNSQIYFGG